MKPHGKLLNAPIVLSHCAIVLIVWSAIVWNLWGCDYRIWPGVVDLAAIEGWFSGWLALTPFGIISVSILLIRRQPQRSSK